MYDKHDNHKTLFIARKPNKGSIVWQSESADQRKECLELAGFELITALDSISLVPACKGSPQPI